MSYFSNALNWVTSMAQTAASTLFPAPAQASEAVDPCASAKEVERIVQEFRAQNPNPNPRNLCAWEQPTDIWKLLTAHLDGKTLRALRATNKTWLTFIQGDEKLKRAADPIMIFNLKALDVAVDHIRSCRWMIQNPSRDEPQDGPLYLVMDDQGLLLAFSLNESTVQTHVFHITHLDPSSMDANVQYGNLPHGLQDAWFWESNHFGTENVLLFHMDIADDGTIINCTRKTRVWSGESLRDGYVTLSPPPNAEAIELRMQRFLIAYNDRQRALGELCPFYGMENTRENRSYVLHNLGKLSALYEQDRKWLQHQLLSS